MTVGLLLLAFSNVASWAALRQISHREATHAAEKCADPRGVLALRHQWARVADIIVRTQLKPANPKYIPPREASMQFARSYQDAIREAGPPPNCLGSGDR